MAYCFTVQSRNSRKSPSFIDLEGLLPYREEPAAVQCVLAPVIPVHAPAFYLCKINADIILTLNADIILTLNADIILTP
jgi:hypothetical protein